MLCGMRGSQTSVLLASLGMLLLVVLVARGTSAVPSTMTDPGLERGLPSVSMSGSNSTSASLLQYSPNDPVLFAKIIGALAAILIVLAIALSVLSWWRNRIRHRVIVGVSVAPVEGTIDTGMRVRLRDAVEEARDLLARAGGSSRDAVIQAWVTLENAADHKRAPHETATEFTVALLEKESADEEALRDLRTLYHRARFGRGDDTDDTDAADRARQALDRILATIR